VTPLICAFHVPRTGDVTGASLYVENTTHYAGPNLQVREIATVRLDTLAAREQLPAPDLVKIDVQGAELEVLAGASATLAGASVLVVEVSLVDYNKRAPLMADLADSRSNTVSIKRKSTPPSSSPSACSS